MRKLMVFLCAILLVLGIFGIAGAAPVYVYDGGLGTWSDVNKASVSGSPDSLLCWAAAASDALAWTGWRGWDSGTSSYIDTAGGIYGKFVGAWPNTEGAPTYAYEWWMTARTESNIRTNPADPNSPTTKVFPSAGLNFYPTVHVQDGDPTGVTAFVKSGTPGQIYTFLGTYINADRGIVASINVPNGPGTLGPYSHTVTVWGWDPATNLLYLTDSDDGQTALRQYPFFQSGGEVYIQGYTNLYTSATNAEITQLTRLNRNDTGIEPNHGVTPPAVPEPSTMLLLGSGLIGLAGYARRRFKK